MEGRTFNPPDELSARIGLLQIRGMGPVKTGDLFDAFGSAEGVCRATESELLKVPGMTSHMVSRIQGACLEANVKADREAAQKEGYSLLSIRDQAFPKLLGSIYAPPALLWSTGTEFPDGRMSVAIVGTRRPSPNGKSVAYSLSYELASCGYTVVSGLAYGIDAVAHEAALDAGGRTIAVLGSGLDRLYPRSNRGLAHRIRAQGCILSEFPLQMEARPGHFPRRNRIISGLAAATIVVEAYETGGALLTARMALDQDRDVFAVPGAVGNPAAAGTNRLIQRGEAQLLMTSSEFLESRPQYHGLSAAEHRPVPAEHQAVLDALSSEPMHIDDLSTILRWPVSKLLIILLRLECANRIRQLPGKHFTRFPAGSF